ncbi:DUF3097 domain-containing protein [Kineococcus rhizosphaerae]|uniref:DUF3097 family protein n=1 Tax=Kineococcus rhizosphaerae TaxID=559628 RepID=A0A2T0R7W3_9ACTN|nr:DUF3097 domain-containing protein [Kineococcus rhizosphaerae]PRY17263.1 Protein of unknown function (DUF3097) [Kineococcus rhizosphaerae]
MTRYDDRYGADVLSADPHARSHLKPTHRDEPAVRGLVVEDVDTGWVGAVVRVEKSGGVHVVVLEDAKGRTRTFPLGPGFWVEGQPVRLVAPKAAGPVRPTRTASGSVAVPGAGARTARASRILVEGRHDAELVEKVWGDDLRVEGVVVEMLDGVDDLDAAIRSHAPRPGRRIGVLVDHLVPGSKESRIVAKVGANPHVLVLGHPFIDVWQSVRPQRLGWTTWPTIPRGQDWKHGVLAELGWPHATQADVAHGWKRILGTVRTYADLEPALLGRVEELVDFVTADLADR